tara:strand:- start:686 stop:823 length:138 start_codon:yes stop_codon:yes gene_type:complete
MKIIDFMLLAEAAQEDSGSSGIDTITFCVVTVIGIFLIYRAFKGG